MTQDWDVDEGGRERGIWSKRKERTCIYEIFTMCEAWSVLYIFLLLILTSVHWVDIIIPDILMTTWRLNNISKIKQWWSWSLKIVSNPWSFQMFVWIPRLVCFCLVSVNCPSHSSSNAGSHWSALNPQSLSTLFSISSVLQQSIPLCLLLPIHPSHPSDSALFASLVPWLPLDPKLTWIFNYAALGYLRLASPLVWSNTRTPLW